MQKFVEVSHVCETKCNFDQKAVGFDADEYKFQTEIYSKFGSKIGLFKNGGKTFNLKVEEDIATFTFYS